MLRSKMLDKDESHSGIGGKVLQEPRECLNPPAEAPAATAGKNSVCSGFLFFGIP
jgi:hypothetical protein